MSTVESSIGGGTTNALIIATKPSFLAYFIYFVVFFISLLTIKKPGLEIFSFTIFFIANFFYSILITTDIKNYVFGVNNINNITEMITPFFIISALALNFVSSIFTFMTLNEIREKFIAINQKVEVQQSIRRRLDIVETLFYGVVFTLTISVLTLFNKGNIVSSILGYMGLETYIVSIKIFIMLLLFVCASFIMYIFDKKAKDNMFKKLKTSYTIMFSLIVAFILFFPLSYLLRKFTSFMFTDISLTVLAGILITALLALTGKFIYDSVDLYKNKSKEVNRSISDIGLFNILILIVFICLLVLLLIPTSYSSIIFKYVFPSSALAMSIYLLVETHDMSTLSNKQLVK